MRTFGQILVPLMRDSWMGQGDFVAFTLFPRQDLDLEIAADLLAPDKSLYPLLVLATLAAGYRQGYLLRSDIKRIIRDDWRPDESKLYNRRLAVALAAAVNNFATDQLRQTATPVLIVNQQVIPDPQATTAIQLKSVLRS